MDSKFYVSSYAARLLKERGYRQTCHAYYFGNSNLRKGGYRGDSWYDSPDFYPAPTKAEAIDWLESKGMRINIIYDWLECRWYFTIINGSPTVKNITELEVSDSGFYKTRLEAEEAAIIKALELL